VDPPPDVWLSLHVQSRTSTIHGRGLFTTEPIAAGTVVARFGGEVVNTAELLARISPAGDDYVDAVALPGAGELVLPAGTGLHDGNHSCVPNLRRYGLALRASRNIAVGEELTVNYGELSRVGWSMSCQCGEPTCRGQITGEVL
jgi:uncharacterized protein